KRIASAGNSGGGTQSAYLAVFEPRLAAAVVSCYMTRWQELWDGPGPQDMEQVFPRFLSEGFDFADFLFAMGGKPSLMTTAIRDFFPIAGARATRDLLRDANVAYFEYDDTHGWSQPRREAMARFLDQKFFGRDSDGKEAPAELEPDSRLWVTPTGQLANSFGSETVHTLNKARAAQLAAKPRTLTREELERFLGVKRRTPLAFPRGTVERGDVTVEKLELELETGLKIPALLFRPAIPPRNAPALVALATAGKASLVAECEAFAKAGTVVLAIDPRGVGEGRRASQRSGYTPTYQAAARAWLLGMSPAQFQVEDTLAAFAYLESRAEVDPARVRLFGRGAAGVVVQLAGALEPRAAGVISEQAVRSWKDIADARIHENQTDIVIPGVLERFDLADVQRLIAPRALELVNPAHPAGSLLPPKAPYKERPEFVPAAGFYAGR
nr:hypothetical protein [Bryobacter sp.]